MPKVAIITARGGSKRIPGKNIKLFLGKPVIAYSIEAALQSRLFDEVMVSTDDLQIAEVAKQFGAAVPFMRSAAAADDFATTSDALTDVFNSYAQIEKVFEYGCCIYPAAPFITSARLVAAFNKLVELEADTVFPVMPFSYPVYRALQEKENKLRMIWEEHRDARSQDLPQAYHDAGQFYFFNVQSFLRNCILITHNVAGIKISELEGQDMDNFTDWQLGEMKYRLLANTNE